MAISLGVRQKEGPGRMEKLRVFATSDVGEEALQRLIDRGYEVEVFPRIEPPPKALILEKVASGIDGLITTLRDAIDEEIFRAGRDTLKIVAQDAVGFDNIDREAANRYRIPFANTADVLTDATAEFAFFLMGCVSRKLYPSERLVREKNWTTWHPYHPFLGDEVTGKIVSVIGTGRIGKAFILKCTSLDMDILCYDVYQDQAFVDSVQRLLDERHRLGLSKEIRIRYVSLQEALRQGDYVSLHVPLMEGTHHLMNDATFEQMKPSAYLINTSRGPIVDEDALYRALKSNQIAGAALDVFEHEPLPDDSSLRDPELEDRLRIFHHFASAGRRTRLSPDPELGMAGRCVQAVIDVLAAGSDGDPAQMPYVVNKEAFKSD